jgi:hypothetical protein
MREFLGDVLMKTGIALFVLINFPHKDWRQVAVVTAALGVASYVYLSRKREVKVHE